MCMLRGKWCSSKTHQGQERCGALQIALSSSRARSTNKICNVNAGFTSRGSVNHWKGGIDTWHPCGVEVWFCACILWTHYGVFSLVLSLQFKMCVVTGGSTRGSAHQLALEVAMPFLTFWTPWRRSCTQPGFLCPVLARTIYVLGTWLHFLLKLRSLNTLCVMHTGCFLANSCKSPDCGVLVDGFPRTAVLVQG
jgi:hypothetical protein